MGVSCESVYVPPSKGICAEARSLEYSVVSAFSRCSSGTISLEKVRRSISVFRNMRRLYLRSNSGLYGEASMARSQRWVNSCSSGAAESINPASAL